MEPDINYQKALALVDPKLFAYIEEDVFPCYQGVDPAHDETHVRTVVRNALVLALNYEVDMNMVYAVACYHDIGIRYGRADHEITSAKWLREDPKLEEFFNPEQIVMMAEAIVDHRASSDHEPRSIYGRIIAEADRDINPRRILRRSLQFTRSNNPDLSDEEIMQISLRHIREKYGPNGYLKLYLNDPRNEEGLQTLRDWLESGEILALMKEELSKI